MGFSRLPLHTANYVMPKVAFRLFSMEIGLDVGISQFYLLSIRLVELFQGQLGVFKLLFEMKVRLFAGSASHFCLPLAPNLGG